MKTIIFIFLTLFSMTAFAQKISVLPVATGAGTGSLVPIVQGGITKQIVSDSLISPAKRYADSLQAIAASGINTNAAAIQQRTDSLRNNAGILEAKKGGVFVPQFTLPTGGGAGTVTNVATGLGLLGGAITTTGTIIVDTSNASILSRQRAAATYQPTGSYLTANQPIVATATGDVTGTSSSSGTAPSLPLVLANVNSTPGVFGSASQSLTVTVNPKGLVTALSAQSIQVAESQVTNLVTDLAAKQPTISLTTTGTSGASTLTGSTLNIPNYAGGGGAAGDTIFYNIKSFGAVGDTVTNNTTAIQNAINAAHVKGGTVFIPGGVYKTNTLNWYSNVRITGSGKGSTLKAISAQPVIKFFGTTAFDNSLNSQTVAFSPIDNIQIDGTGVAGVTGLDMANSGVMYFNNVRIFNCDTATKLSGVIIAHFNECDFEFGKIGLFIKDGKEGGVSYLPTNVVTFDKGRITYFSKQAVFANNFAMLNFTYSNIEYDGTIGDATTGGIYLKVPYVTSNETIGLTLKNCWFEGIAGTMVHIEDGTYSSTHNISNNTFIVLAGTGSITTLDISAPSYVNNVYLSQNKFVNTSSATIKATGQSNIYYAEPIDATITRSITAPAKFLPFNYNVVSVSDTVLTNGLSQFNDATVFNLPYNATGNPTTGSYFTGLNLPLKYAPTFGGAIATDQNGNFFTRGSNGTVWSRILTDNNASTYALTSSTGIGYYAAPGDDLDNATGHNMYFYGNTNKPPQSPSAVTTINFPWYQNTGYNTQLSTNRTGKIFTRNQNGGAFGTWKEIATFFEGTATYAAPSIASMGTTTTTIAVTGAVLGNYAHVSFGVSLQGIVATAYVSSADVVTIVLFNPTGAAIALASTTVKAKAE